MLSGGKCGKIFFIERNYFILDKLLAYVWSGFFKGIWFYPECEWDFGGVTGFVCCKGYRLRLMYLEWKCKKDCMNIGILKPGSMI
jgi:hypothetical protein